MGRFHSRAYVNLRTNEQVGFSNSSGLGATRAASRTVTRPGIPPPGWIRAEPREFRPRRCHDAFAVVLPAEHSFAFKSDSRRDLLTRPRPVPLFWNWRQRATRKSQIFQISGGYLTFDLGKSDSRSPRFEVEPRLNQQSLPLFIVSSDTTKSSLSRSRSREEILPPDGRADGQNWIEFARMAIPRTREGSAFPLVR
jgi:hypothetical protein